jgi:hypothetical protein
LFTVGAVAAAPSRHRRACGATFVHFLTTAREVAGRAPFTAKGVTQVLRIFRETLQHARLLDKAHAEAIESSLAEANQKLNSSFDGSIGDVSSYSASRPYTSDLRTESRDGWTEEPLTDEVGEPNLIRYRGKPSRKRYEFIRDYLDLKIKRLERDS